MEELLNDAGIQCHGICQTHIFNNKLYDGQCSLLSQVLSLGQGLILFFPSMILFQQTFTI